MASDKKKTAFHVDGKGNICSEAGVIAYFAEDMDGFSIDAKTRLATLQAENPSITFAEVDRMLREENLITAGQGIGF